MNILRKVFVIVLVIVFCSVLKRLLDKYSPVSIIFHYNFLTALQYLLLFGLIIWLLVQAVSFVTRKRYVKTKYFIVMFLAILAGTEGYLYYAIRHSAGLTGRFHNLVTEYYVTYEINYPKMSYDSVLSYTLPKNTVYPHRNIEFTNDISANSLGLRDDNNSLSRPDVICLGDSYTMGWGVDNKRTFPELIEQSTGMKVLNAGMTSYGTARELLLLNRLDTSNLKYLVIQYCYNDGTENLKFLQNKGYLPIGTQKTMDHRFRSHELARSYFPFKYSLTISRLYIRDMLSSFAKRDSSEMRPWYKSLDYVSPDAHSFLHILNNSNINFGKWKVILVDMNRYPAFEHHFLDSVQNLLNTRNYQEDLRKNLQIVRFPELNDQRYFLPLDNHLNEEGHKLIARKIIEAIKNDRTQ